MTIDVRTLLPEDRGAWDPLWTGYLSFYRSHLSAEVTDLTWQRFHDPAEPMHALGAWEGDDLLGLCHHLFHRSTWSLTTYCYLEDLFTLPAARGRGIGRRLIEATADAALAAGAEKLYWQTDASNRTARSLYDRVGHHDGSVLYERNLAVGDPP